MQTAIEKFIPKRKIAEFEIPVKYVLPKGDSGKAEILVVFFSSAFTKEDRTNFPIVTVSEVGKKLLNCRITELDSYPLG